MWEDHRNHQIIMKLHIKNMVCNRCKMVVKAELERLGLYPVNIELGEVTLQQDLTLDQRATVTRILEGFGFGIIDDKKGQLVESVKTLIISLIHERDIDIKTNLSDFISKHVGQDYNHVSKLFSEMEGTTIEKYFIAQKIERVKELLVYGENTLSEIAYQLHYSSVAHLSNQFKKVTGLSPSFFKSLRSRQRKPLDEV